MYIIRILSVCSVAASRLGPFGSELTEEFGYQLSHRCISATGWLILADEYRISILTHQSIKSEFNIVLMIQILRETEREGGVAHRVSNMFFPRTCKHAHDAAHMLLLCSALLNTNLVREGDTILGALSILRTHQPRYGGSKTMTLCRSLNSF